MTERMIEGPAYDSVQVLSHSDAEDQLHAALEGGSRIYRLDGLSIVDTHTFFEAAGHCLPLKPCLGPYTPWHAFADTLFAGLVESGDSSVMIFWDHAESIAAKAPEEFEIARLYLDDVASDLCDPRMSPRLPVKLTTVFSIHGAI